MPVLIARSIQKRFRGPLPAGTTSEQRRSFRERGVEPVARPIGRSFIEGGKRLAQFPTKFIKQAFPIVRVTEEAIRKRDISPFQKFVEEFPLIGPKARETRRKIEKEDPARAKELERIVIAATIPTGRERLVSEGIITEEELFAFAPPEIFPEVVAARPFSLDKMSRSLAREILGVGKDTTEKIVKDAFNKTLRKDPKLLPKLQGLVKESGRKELEILQTAKDVLIKDVPKEPIISPRFIKAPEAPVATRKIVSKELEPLLVEARKFKTAEEFTESLIKGGKVLSINDKIPKEVAEIFNDRLRGLIGKGIPDNILEKATLGDIAKFVDDFGITDDVFRESTIALRQLGFRKIGKQNLTEFGMKSTQELTDIFNQAKGVSKELEPITKEEFTKAIKEFEGLERGVAISEPALLLELGKITPQDVKVIGAQVDNVEITRQAIKHIVEQRGERASEFIQSIPDILRNPSKIADNSAKRLNSFLFVKMNGKAKGVVLEVTKTPDGNRVVSAFPIDRKTFRKLRDISGRPDVPPLDVSPVESAISTAQKVSDIPSIAKTDIPVKARRPLKESAKDFFSTLPGFNPKLVTPTGKPRMIRRETLEKLKVIYAKRIAKLREEKKALVLQVDIIKERRAFVKAIQKQFNLEDADLKRTIIDKNGRERRIRARDIRLMSDTEFKEFLGELQRVAEDLTRLQEARAELRFQIESKELDIENLRLAMKFPKISDMNIQELGKFVEVLQPFQRGDRFLSKRKLETIDRTELKGLKTHREVIEFLAAKLDITPAELSNFKISEFDKFRGESSLAEKAPFFRMMVEETAKLRLIREAEFLDIEKKLFELVKRPGVKGKIKDIIELVPQQKRIVEWFESTDKDTVQLTPREQKIAAFMQEEWIKARDYLIKVESIDKGLSSGNYFTHVRRGILETIKEDGVIKVSKELFDQYKLDLQVFRIIDGETGEIMALDKFFRFAVHRTGELKPTDNIVKAFLIYMRTFKRKQALDEIVPLIDIYANALTPKGKTKTGILLHGSLIRFTKEWLNTQKGRRIKILAEQGGPADWALRAGNTFISFWFLAGKFTISAASQFGEQAVAFQVLGLKDTAISKFRALNPLVRKKRSRILEKYRNLVGKNPWSELVEPAKGSANRIAEGLFILFRDANVRRNKNILLGKMTKEEWKSETISPERLAQMRIATGRYGVLDGAKSIFGATPEVQTATKFITWALPIISTNIRNMGYLSRWARSKGKLNKEEAKFVFVELSRTLELAGFVGIIYALARPDENDNSFLTQLKRRAFQESLTIVQTFNPTTIIRNPVLTQFIIRFTANLVTLATLQRYELSKFGEFKEGELKGLRLLRKQFTPAVIKQFQREQKKEVSDIYKEILEDIEAGVLSIEAAKLKEIDELSKLEAKQKRELFKLPLKEYQKDLLERINNGVITIEDAKLEEADFLEKNPGKFASENEDGFIGLVFLYARALGVDPVVAVNRIFTNQRIRKIESGAIIIERDIGTFGEPTEFSTKTRKKLGATKGDDLRLDHTIPIQLEGDDDEDNVRLVTLDEWARYTPVENYLGDAFRSRFITLKKAQRLIREFKEGKITEDDVVREVGTGEAI